MNVNYALWHDNGLCRMILPGDCGIMYRMCQDEWKYEGLEESVCYGQDRTDIIRLSWCYTLWLFSFGGMWHKRVYLPQVEDFDELK